MLQFWVLGEDLGQTSEGVSHGERFGLVISLSWAVISSRSNDLSSLGIDNYEAAGADSFLGSPVELDVDRRSRLEPGFGGDVDRCLESSFRRGHRLDIFRG